MNKLYYPFIIELYQALQSLPFEFAFVGGMAVSLYETKNIPIEIRPTTDLDCIVNITTRGKYYSLQEFLRDNNFKEDTSDGAPICRWIYNGIVVDIMPVDADILGFNNRWYAPGIQELELFQLTDEIAVPILSYGYFMATKFEAMNNREGGVDLRWNHDFEDILHLLIHREHAVSDLVSSEKPLKEYLIFQFETLFSNPRFLTEAVQSNLAHKGYTKFHHDLAFDLIKELSKS